ncbi:MAG: uracil-DNA glycosylase family protein [Alphaproteobacteria bacterium]
MDDFNALLTRVRDCTICAADLPLGPRPIVRGTPDAKLLLIGQAPGTRVHESGVPWNDPSGERLRDWLQMTPDDFYDESKIAIVPMGFCYPGADAKGGDKPPRPECAPEWHPPLLAGLPNVELTILIGQYAQKRYLEKRRKKTLTETVRHWREYTPDFLPLPHPSWRNNVWVKKNPWFAEEVLPMLRERVAELFS